MSYVKCITNHQGKKDLDFIKSIYRQIQKHYHYTGRQMYNKFPDLHVFISDMECNNIRIDTRLFMKYSILVEDEQEVHT